GERRWVHVEDQGPVVLPEPRLGLELAIEVVELAPVARPDDVARGDERGEVATDRALDADLGLGGGEQHDGEREEDREDDGAGIGAPSPCAAVHRRRGGRPVAHALVDGANGSGRARAASGPRADSMRTSTGTSTPRLRYARAAGDPSDETGATLVSRPTSAPSTTSAAPVSGACSPSTRTPTRRRGVWLPRESMRATSSWPV